MKYLHIFIFSFTFKFHYKMFKKLNIPDKQGTPSILGTLFFASKYF